MKSLSKSRLVCLILAVISLSIIFYKLSSQFSGKVSRRYVEQLPYWNTYREFRDKTQSTKSDSSNSSEILNLMEKKNRAGLIRNRRLIEHQLATNSSLLVILVQVHSRANYLKALIDSLRDVQGIERTLVVFSHDIYDDQMNRLVESIRFCATLQIFYPLAMQVNPRRFPGRDACDCPKNLKKSESLLMNCCNAAYPDTFGHNREAEFTQIKHHWTWKVRNYIIYPISIEILTNLISF